MFLSLVEVNLYVNCILRGLLPDGGSHTDAFSVPEHHEWAFWEPLTSPPDQDWRVLSSPLSLNIVQHACDPQCVS